MAENSLYADGGVIQKNPSAIGGTWAWVRVVDDEVMDHDEGVIPGSVERRVTNNVSELAAVVYGILALPDGWEGTIYTDSHVTICRVFQGGALNGVPDWLRMTLKTAQARLYALRRAGKPLGIGIRAVLLDGHPTKAQLAAGIGKRGSPCSEWNVLCDETCSRIGREYALSEEAKADQLTASMATMDLPDAKRTAEEYLRQTNDAATSYRLRRHLRRLPRR